MNRVFWDIEIYISAKSNNTLNMYWSSESKQSETGKELQDEETEKNGIPGEEDAGSDRPDKK